MNILLRCNPTEETQCDVTHTDVGKLRHTNLSTPVQAKTYTFTMYVKMYSVEVEHHLFFLRNYIT
jgi:hypothetical protein